MALRLALFDCDGTLVDSQANICAAMESAFAGAGMGAPPRSEIRRIVGLSVLEAVTRLLPEAEEAALMALAEAYKKAFFDMRGQGLIDEPLYDGMEALLRNLYAGGWQLGVATGKSDRGLNKCLEHHDIMPLFVTLQTADRHPSKPHPAMVHQAMQDACADAASTVMIGDTVYDIDMARAAGCRSIAVGWGYHRLDEMRRAGADHTAETMDELAAILEEMA